MVLVSQKTLLLSEVQIAYTLIVFFQQSIRLVYEADRQTKEQARREREVKIRMKKQRRRCLSISEYIESG